MRLFIILLSKPFYDVLQYRIERSLYLVFDDYYKCLKLPLYPIFLILKIISNIDIHYKTDIKGGINIHHASTRIVISVKSIIGKNLTLTGGNTIGLNKSCKRGEFIIGSNCNLGANSVILEPPVLGNTIKIAN